MKKQVWIIFSIFLSVHVFCQERTSAEITKGRERLSMDSNWLFALGHAYDTEKDFNHGTAYFPYFAKTGLPPIR